jgi:hypothetical protein
MDSCAVVRSVSIFVGFLHDAIQQLFQFFLSWIFRIEPLVVAFHAVPICLPWPNEASSTHSIAPYNLRKNVRYGSAVIYALNFVASAFGAMGRLTKLDGIAHGFLCLTFKVRHDYSWRGGCEAADVTAIVIVCSAWLASVFFF